MPFSCNEEGVASLFIISNIADMDLVLVSPNGGVVASVHVSHNKGVASPYVCLPILMLNTDIIHTSVSRSVTLPPQRVVNINPRTRLSIQSCHCGGCGLYQKSKARLH